MNHGPHDQENNRIFRQNTEINRQNNIVAGLK